jgi:O-antigen ligase
MSHSRVVNNRRASLFPGSGAERVGIFLLLLFLLAAPVPWGGVTALGALAISLSAALLFGLSASLPDGRVGRLALVAWSLVGMGLLGALQLLPLPETLLARVSPASLETYHAAAEMLRVYGRSDALAPRVSIAPEETRAVLLLALAYAALLVGSTRLLRGRRTRRLFASVLLAGMILHVFYAAAKPTADGRLHGVFVNPNHLAAYLAIGLFVALGSVWAELLTGRDREYLSDEAATRFERRFLPLALRLLAVAALAIGIGLTQSRGAILATSAAAAVSLALGLLHTRVRRRRRRLAVGLALFLGIALAIAAATAGRGPLLRFYSADPQGLRADARGAIWASAIEAWRSHPILGSGLGTFREAFRSVQPREIEGQVEQAHNDFLQILVTGGVVGAALAVFAAAATLLLLLRAWWRQKHREESAVVLGGIGAVLFVLIHGIVEFDLSIPAIPATLAIVVGGAWAAGRAR